MSNIYTFSEESKPLLQQCLEAAAKLPPDENNKWLQRFGPRNLDLVKKTDEIVLIEDSPEIVAIGTPADDQEDILKIVEALTDPDVAITSQIELIYKTCSDRPKQLTKLAENLPIEIIEAITLHILESATINNQFLQYFYQYFIPITIKKTNARFCTELLLKTYKLQDNCFKILIEVIFKDTDIQNSILNDFILSLNADQQSKLIIDISNIELSSEEFTNNIFNIYTAYKSCNKGDSIQKYILSLLKTYSYHCSADKSYGKLLLTYLQQEKVLKRNINYTDIEKIIEIHKSPFKRPCLAVLEEINKS